MKDFNYRDYFMKVTEIVGYIRNTMEENGIELEAQDMQPNPAYGQIIKNGGIGLEFYCGFPTKVLTPLGFITISINDICSDENLVYEKIFERLGLVCTREKKVTLGGSSGPYFAITKDLSGDEIPQYTPKEHKEYIEYTQAHKIYSEFKEFI